MLDLTTIPWEQSALGWRFDRHRSSLPPHHLGQVQPLSPGSATRLLDLTRPWLREQPFTPGWFADVASIPIGRDDDDTEQACRVRKWLYRRGVPFGHPVFLSWSGNEAAVTTWKMVVKYWDDLWLPVADDLTVFDGSLSWALFLWHEGEAFFATRPTGSVDRHSHHEPARP